MCKYNFGIFVILLSLTYYLYIIDVLSGYKSKNFHEFHVFILGYTVKTKTWNLQELLEKVISGEKIVARVT